MTSGNRICDKILYVILLISYHNGNDEDKGQIRGFGHTGFLVDNLEAACEHLEASGVKFKKKPSEGTMRGPLSKTEILWSIVIFYIGLAFAYDPDGYWVEIIQRGGLKMIE